jgi:hypothetical protein
VQDTKESKMMAKIGHYRLSISIKRTEAKKETRYIQYGTASFVSIIKYLTSTIIVLFKITNGMTFNPTTNLIFS